MVINAVVGFYNTIAYDYFYCNYLLRFPGILERLPK